MSKRCCAKMCFNSVLSNKNVCYFGFPKELGYATAWAVAADRSDLLGKSLNNLVKYYLCAEHFSDECFVDPPANTKLRKTTRPVTAPIPSIFECNISRFVSKKNQNDENTVLLQDDHDLLQPEELSTPPPSQEAIPSPMYSDDHVNFGFGHELDCERIDDLIRAKQKFVDVDDNDDDDDDDDDDDVNNDNTHNTLPFNTASSVVDDVPPFDDINLESEKDIYESYVDYLELDVETALKSNVKVGKQENNVEEIVHEREKDDEQKNQEHESNEETINVNQICRLCAELLHEEDDFVKLFSGEGESLTDNIQQLLPNSIYRDDFLPQQVCMNCVDQIDICINTINSFRKTQELFRQIT